MQTNGAHCDLHTMYHRVSKVTDALRSGIELLLEKGKVEPLVGFGKVEGLGVVSINGERFGADRILLAVGSKPARPPIPGLSLYGEGHACLGTGRLCTGVYRGCRPVTEEAFAPGVSPKLERGYVHVNGQFETDMPGIYAVGYIVAEGIQLAHVAEAQAKNAVRAMFGLEDRKNLSAIPARVFTDPEIATVGIIADEAKAEGRAVTVHKSLTSSNGKSVVEGAERGFAKLVFDKGNGALVGAQIMCPHASEMIGGLTTAITAGLTEAQLAHTIFPHPTVREIPTIYPSRTNNILFLYCLSVCEGGVAHSSAAPQ